MADLESLVTDDSSSPVPGAPKKYRIIQDSDILEVRAYFGTGTSDPYLAAAAFLANQETHLYGELVMATPAIRHAGILSLNNISNDDIVSFRSGSAPGDEVLRVKANGDVQYGTTRTAYVSVHSTAFFINLYSGDLSDAGIFGGGSFAETYLYTTNTASSRQFFCGFPVRIPQRATVTKIGMLYRTNGTAPNNYVSVIFCRTDLDTNSGTTIYTLDSNNSSAAIAYKEDTLNSPEIINYEDYAYSLRVVIRNSSESNSRFYALRITYEFDLIGQ
jgi:hypothetical protein